MELLLERMVSIGAAEGVFHADEATKNIVVGSKPALEKNFIKDFRQALQGVCLWAFVEGLLKARYETVAARPFY
jgi:hypothetical protein